MREGTCGFLGGRGVIVRSARGAVGGGSVELGIVAVIFWVVCGLCDVLSGGWVVW